VVGRATGQFGVRSNLATDFRRCCAAVSWVGGLTINSEHRSPPSMARRKGRSNYKQVKTGTVDLGTEGAQVHIAEIKMIDEALRGSFLNNVQFSVMQQHTQGHSEPVTAWSSGQAFTLYLSYESSSWHDDSVIAVSSTPVGGGNGNLTCKRVIKTNETGSTVAEQIGRSHQPS